MGEIGDFNLDASILLKKWRWQLYIQKKLFSKFHTENENSIKRQDKRFGGQKIKFQYLKKYFIINVHCQPGIQKDWLKKLWERKGKSKLELK